MHARQGEEPPRTRKQPLMSYLQPAIISHRFLYSSSQVLRRPLPFFRGGIHGQTPLRRSHPHKRSESFARSATGLIGRSQSRPRLRGTQIRSRIASANLTSAQLELANRKASEIPFLSAAYIRFVPLPTSVQSISSPPFCRNEAPIQKGSCPLQFPFLIHIGKECLPDLVLHPFLLPPWQSPPRRYIRSVLLRNVLPTTTGSQNIQNPI